jgi:transposase-like protein DUF772
MLRGADGRSGSLFSYVDLEARVRPLHPLRVIQEIANMALADLKGEFSELYPARLGRPSIPPERLLRAMLLQAFYGIRSERQLMERIEFDLTSKKWLNLYLLAFPIRKFLEHFPGQLSHSSLQVRDGNPFGIFQIIHRVQDLFSRVASDVGSSWDVDQESCL